MLFERTLGLKVGFVVIKGMQFIDLLLRREMIDFSIRGHLIVLIVELDEATLLLLQIIEINLLLVALCWAVLI